MNTTLIQSNLEYGLGIIMGAVDKKKIGDYSDSIFMDSERGAGNVVLHATDMELFASITVDCVETADGGSIVLPAEKFLSAIKGCGPGEVSICSGTDLKSSITGTAAEYEISGYAPVDYPVGYHDDTRDLVFNFSAGDVQMCINAVRHAVCRDLTKQTLCGINFSLKPLDGDSASLTIAATDGHRLSLATLEIPGENIIARGETHTFTLPGKASDLLTRITAKIGVGRVAKQNRLYFQSGSISVCVSEGTREYPDVRRIVPTGPGEIITIETDALSGAIESCCIMSDDQYRSVNLAVSGETITVTALGTNNTARAKVPCLSDSEIKIRMNSHYLLQAIKSIDSTEIFIKYFGPASPVMILPADHKRWNERIEIVMPLGGE